jgi:hypothetical protein
MSGRNLVRCTTIGCFVLGAALATTWFVGSPSVWAADDSKAQPPGAQQPAQQASSQQPSDKLPGGYTAEQMQAMMKAATPGPEHAKLKEMEGTWDADVKMFNPDGTTSMSKGTMKAKMIMDGRVLQMHFDGDFMGQPFKGLAMTGFDNTEKKYWNIWMDSMGTGVMITKGAEQDGKIVNTGEMMCPADNKPCMVREVHTPTDKDHHFYEMYNTMSGQPEMKAMEITYTRKS